MLERNMDSITYLGYAATNHGSFGFGTLSDSESVRAAVRATRAARAAAAGAISATQGALPPAATYEPAPRDAA
jgi:hypothetical protein